jgi:hypothetical protein
MNPASTSPLAVLEPEGDASARLRLKPQGRVSGRVDGAWWPRSRNLPTELPPLVAALDSRVGRVARVGYHLGGWDRAPRRLPAGSVRLEGFRTTDAHALTVVGFSGTRIVLLVVPPDTSDSAAEAALRAAADPGDRHSTAELLAGETGAASS